MRDELARKARALAALLAALCAAAAVQAREERHEHGPRHEQGREAHREHHEFHGGRAAQELRHYIHAHEAVRRYGWAEPAGWHGGRWDHGCRAGRCGWWWWAGGHCYYYDRPVYPYPVYPYPPVLPGAR